MDVCPTNKILLGGAPRVLVAFFTGLMFLWDLLETYNEAAGKPAAFFVGNGWKRARVTNHEYREKEPPQ